MADILVFGNAAEDFIVRPDEILNLNDSEIEFAANGAVRRVRVQGNIRSDEKPRFDGMSIDDVLEGIPFEREGGGGGLHSAVWLAKNGMSPFYVDVSAPKDTVSEKLRGHGIESRFLGCEEREVPKNLILDLRKFGLGEVVVRGSKLKRIGMLEADHHAELAHLASNAGAMFLNAPKDDYVVRHLVKMVPDDVQIMFVFSDSLPRTFMMDELMPRGISAISRKGLYKFGEKLGIKNGDGSSSYPAEIMKALRSRNLSNYPLLAVTGGEGVMCSAWNTVYNIYLDPNHLQKAQTRLAAGREEDVFVAAILREYLTQGIRHPVETAISASIAELANRGYNEARPELFKVEVMGQKTRTRYRVR